jgi:hypothetical protein
MHHLRDGPAVERFLADSTAPELRDLIRGRIADLTFHAFRSPKRLLGIRVSLSLSSA